MHRRRKRRFYNEILKKVILLFATKCHDLNKVGTEQVTKWREIEDIASAVQSETDRSSRMSVDILKKLLTGCSLLEANHDATAFRRNPTCPSSAECTVYVEELDEEMTERELREAFGRYGTVVDLYLPKRLPRHGPDATTCAPVEVNRGFAFIQFDNEAAAYRACAGPNSPPAGFGSLIVGDTAVDCASCSVASTPALTGVQGKEEGSTTTIKNTAKRRRRSKNLRRKRVRAFRQCLNSKKRFYVISWSRWKELKRVYLQKQADSFRLLKKQLLPYRKIIPRTTGSHSMRGRDKLLEFASEVQLMLGTTMFENGGVPLVGTSPAIAEPMESGEECTSL